MMINNVYTNDIYIHMLFMFMILFYSFFSCIYILYSNHFNTILKIFAIFIISFVIYLSIQKETFLPFLGMSFLPSNLILDEKIPQGANIEYTIDLKEYEGAYKIVYWAANKSGKTIEDPYEAYKDFHNVGVSKIVNGKAIVKIYCPDNYKVNHFGVHTSLIDKHFHYRVIFKENGFMSPVMTIKVNC